MPFGSTEKCKACGKTVHFAEMVSADGVPYHRTCFRCSHCNGLLSMSNYSQIDGTLYCKAHFEQISKERGFTTNTSSKSSDKPNSLTRAPSKLSHLFSGTQDKCAICSKTVYPLEKLTVEGAFYHKSCFRCSHGGCFLNPSSYAALDGILYCKPHFAQLFKEKGSYNHLSKTASMKKSGAASTTTTPPPEPESEAGDPKPEEELKTEEDTQ